MKYLVNIPFPNLAPFLLFTAIMLVAAVSRAEELSNLTDTERAWLAQNYSVRVRVSNFPPHIFLDEDQPKGISVDYVNLIAERTGINFVFAEEKSGFWQAVESMGRGAGPDLIVGMENNPERAGGISFSQTYMLAPHVIFTRQESEFVAGIQDLSGKTLATLQGGSNKQIANEHEDINMVLFPSNRAALEAVSKGRADAYMGDLLVATYVIETFGYSNLKVSAPGPLGDRRLCFGNRTDWPELTSIINKALDSVPRAERSAIQGKYLSVRYEYGLRAADVVKWVMIVAGAGLLMIGLVVNWNRRLQRTVERQTAEVVKAATQLEKSKTQLEEGQRISRTGSWEWKTSTEEINWSKGFYNIVGRDPEKPAPSFAEHPKLFTPESFERLNLAAREAIHNGNSYDLDLELIREDGEIRSISAVGEPIRDSAGTVIGLRGSVQDTTEQKRAEEELFQYRQRLKELASQLTVTEERERQRIATDLHDHVCQTLALMRLQLATLKKRVVDPDVANRLEEFSASLLQANQDTRHLMFDLSSPTLHELGLAAAIAEWLEEELQQRHGLRTEFQNVGLTQPLDSDLRALLFRNVRELLTNVVKHAKAQSVQVTLQQSGTTVKLIVQDDGVGFDPNQVSSGERTPTGFGLFSIQERMADMGGSMEVISARDQGCTVTLTLPEAGQSGGKS